MRGFHVAPAGKKQKINLNDCDLTEEQLEELRMISKFKDRDLKYLRVKFLSVLKEGESYFDPSFLFRFPEIQTNPLRKQIVKIFDMDHSGESAKSLLSATLDITKVCCSMLGAIDFREFVRVLSVLSEDGNRVDKLKYAFKLHDYDGDDKISKLDLKLYLQDVTFVETSELEAARNEQCVEEEITAGEAGSVAEKIEYNKKKLEELRNVIKARRKVEKSSKSRRTKIGNKDDAVELDTADENTPATEGTSSAALLEDKERYESRLKYLEKEATIETVVEKVFVESSSDQNYLTQEDFLRVVGHSDFQGKLVLSLINR